MPLGQMLSSSSGLGRFPKAQLNNNDSKLASHTDYYSLPNGVILDGWQQDITGVSFKAVLNITNILQAIGPDANGAESLPLSNAFANNGSALLNVFAIGPSPGKIPAEPDATNISDSLIRPS
jgi:hypothetical protein